MVNYGELHIFSVFKQFIVVEIDARFSSYSSISSEKSMFFPSMVC